MYISEQTQSFQASQQCDVSESLYSRQLLVLGPQAHKKLSTSKILVISINGLSQEICKNLILAGANVDICNLLVCDEVNNNSSVYESPFFDKSDCLTAYYGREKHLKTDIARNLAELNHFVRVNIVNIGQILSRAEIYPDHSKNLSAVEGMTIEEFSQYSLVIAVNVPLPFSYKLNKFLRSLNMPMIVTEQRGFSGYTINDFIKMRSVDSNGESCKIGSITRIERKEIRDMENDEILPLVEDNSAPTIQNNRISSQNDEIPLINHIFTAVERHNLECSNLLMFSNRIYRIKVLSPFTFEINTDHEIESDQFEEIKEQKIFEFLTIKESVEKKIQNGAQINLRNYMPAGNRLAETSLMAFYETLGIFTQKYGRLPDIHDVTDSQERVCDIFNELTHSKYKSDSNSDNKKPDSKYAENARTSSASDLKNDSCFSTDPEFHDSNRMPSLELFASTTRALFQPVISIIGGFVAQEALKCVSERFTPSQDVFLHDCSDILNFEGENLQNFKKCARTSGKNEISEETISQMAAKNFLQSKSVYNPNSPFIDSVFHHLYILFLERTINIFSSNIFLVGAGAIGCEHLKNLYGRVTITDMDTIEESNLNRQFLFRKPDIGQFKSDCAKNSILNMREWWYTKKIKKIITDYYNKILSERTLQENMRNCQTSQSCSQENALYKSITRLQHFENDDPLENLRNPKVPILQSKLNSDLSTDESEIFIKIKETDNIISYKTPVNPSTENIFSDKLLSSFSLIALALDNAEAREYMDSRAVSLKIPLFDSGTLGTKGHTQTVLPFLTESYGSSRDPPEKDIPLCTIRNFPHLIEHCVEWGLAQFNELFVHDTPAGLDNPVKSNISPESGQSDQLDEKIRNSGTVSPLATIHLSPPKTPQECEKYANDLLNFYFFKTINDLISLFPRDHVTEEGLTFWQPPKKFPCVLNMDDPQIQELVKLFLKSCIKLLSDVWAPNLDEQIDSGYENDKYQISDNIGSSTTSSHKTSENQNEFIRRDSFQNTPQFMEKTLNTESKSKASVDKNKKNTITFEKDLDSNEHINFIYATSNLRAYNYRIKQTSHLEVKRIAGRIIPAIATTTAVISGLSCIEMYRYMLNYSRIYKIIKPDHKNLINKLNQSDQENIEDKPLIKLRRYRIPFRHITFINSYINLALPFTSFSEPLPPLTQTCRVFNCKFNLWDEMIVRNCTISHILAQSDKYERIEQHVKDQDLNKSSLSDTPTQNVLNDLEPNELPQVDQSLWLYVPPSIDMLSLNDRIVFCSWDNKKYEKLLEQKIVKKNEGKKRLDILFEKECMECPPMWIGEEE